MSILGNTGHYSDTPYFDAGVSDGVTTTITLPWQPGYNGAIQVFIGGSVQRQSTYTLNGYSLVLNNAPPTGAAVVIFGKGMRALLNVPNLGSVVTSSLNPDGIVIPNGSTATTPPASDSSTKLATTEYVQTIAAPISTSTTAAITAISNSTTAAIAAANAINAAAIASANTTNANAIATANANNATAVATVQSELTTTNNTVTVLQSSIASTVATLLPAGTRMPFAQATAPVGWTQITSDTANNRMLRVVSTTGGGLGGSVSPILNNVVPSHTHGFATGGSSTSHSHAVSDPGHSHVMPLGPYGNPGSIFIPQSDDGPNTGQYYTIPANTTGITIGGMSADHSHAGSTDNGSSQTNWSPRYIDMIICSKN